MNVTVHSDPGPVRKENEDSFHLGGRLFLGGESASEVSLHGAPRLLLVADGMGGAAGGEMASRTACAAAMSCFWASEALDMAVRLRLAFAAANAAVRAEAVREGRFTREQADRSPMRHVVTRAVGTSAAVEVDVFRCSARPGDCLLLCTDGLHGVLDDAEVARILNDPAATAEALVAAALAAGAVDSVTAVLVRV